VKVTWTETHEEEIDFDKITDWSRYPGEMTCIAHGWYEPKSRTLFDEFERRAGIKAEERRAERDKRAASGDPAAKFDQTIEKMMFKTLQAGTNVMCIEKFGEAVT